MWVPVAEAECAETAGDVRRLGGEIGREDGREDDWAAAGAGDGARRSHDHQRRRARVTRWWMPGGSQASGCRVQARGGADRLLLQRTLQLRQQGRRSSRAESTCEE